MNLILHQEVTLHDTKYTVIGIDTYNVKNLQGEHIQWKSYTLQAGKVKTWISYGVNGPYSVEWKSISEAQFQAHEIELAADLSGTANITFEGNPGYSTPFADVFWYRTRNKPYEFLGLERFLVVSKGKIQPSETYYSTGKILQNLDL